MSNLDLARWQFAITTVYHFLFVPITIGLSAMVAGFETQWLRRRNPEMLRLAKFFGKLLLINFALGLVTGIVQEFQFGMNWSAYSRFFGDIFGAPLAFEALLAFFLESTFLGVWIFGWGRIPEKAHAACMWLVHIGTLLSAYFILAANSFMQHPVGWKYNAATGRAELTDFVAVLTNKVQLVTFPHVVASAYLVGGGVVMGVGLWLLHKHRGTKDSLMYRKAARIGAVVTLLAGAGVAVTGDTQGKIMTEVQPMKMAAAEALYTTQDHCAAFSLFTIGSLNGQSQKAAVKVPCVLSFLATGSFEGKVDGINDLKASLPAQLQKQARAEGVPAAYSQPADAVYTPNIPLAYWSFRLMIGVGMTSTIVALGVLWATRKGRTALAKPWVWAGIAVPLLPVLGNSFGWIFTETGRQPWLVYGVMSTKTGVSGNGAGTVLTSMVVFTLLYAALAVVEVRLFLDYTRRGADPAPPELDPDAASADEHEAPAPVSFVY
ncbi:cytochrome ubiquinol oxidase subunit I [Allobranchiibius sp. CTAmp26]|uniref:cytochrome ubiquinol oxidase subunit I n=1 Tax=Allobranchiibius sp. CTAmp26 TaxID=2815214 RepID=UPI001AA1C8AD|nr:cytochrome ubiquinol oxidase subunit I [Allobranchiibius sp. CTAmp26]MBO1754841.1 cytochrome ubiquinol oxidase subunit I [Allobranchiibius sp. CTAmp26]